MHKQKYASEAGSYTLLQFPGINFRTAVFMTVLISSTSCGRMYTHFFFRKIYITGVQNSTSMII